MISRPELTLLEQLEAAGVKVDTDSMDPKVAANLPVKAHDMTSNQLLTNEQLKNPENKELVERTIRELKGANWFDIQTVLVSHPGGLGCGYGSRANWGYRPQDSPRGSSLTSRAVSLPRLPLLRLLTRTLSLPTPVLTTRPSKLRVSLGKLGKPNPEQS